MGAVVVDGVEYSRFGQGFVRRASPDDEWQEVQYDDLDPAVFAEIRAEELIKERGGTRGAAFSAEIIRAPQNDAIARELGFTGDERVDVQNRNADGATPGDVLAQRLNDRGSDGTMVRVTEERFDEIAAQLGMSGEELRVRFAGRYDPDTGEIAPKPGQ